ncbi:MAG: hypothetical protein ABEK01_00530 [Candidatus Nanohaloarchaea archaeon]
MREFALEVEEDVTGPLDLDLENRNIAPGDTASYDDIPDLEKQEGEVDLRPEELEQSEIDYPSEAEYRELEPEAERGYLRKATLATGVSGAGLLGAFKMMGPSELKSTGIDIVSTYSLDKAAHFGAFATGTWATFQFSEKFPEYAEKSGNTMIQRLGEFVDDLGYLETAGTALAMTTAAGLAKESVGVFSAKDLAANYAGMTYMMLDQYGEGGAIAGAKKMASDYRASREISNGEVDRILETEEYDLMGETLVGKDLYDQEA